MRFQREHRKCVAAVAAASLIVAACGGDDDEPAAEAPATDEPAATEPAGDEPAAEEPAAECTTALDEDDSVASLAELDFSGLELDVGSKDFVEQFVIGQMAIVALEAGGATVTDNINLGGTVVNRDALLANEIDMY